MKIKIFAIVNQAFTNTYDTIYYEAQKNPDIEWTFVLIPFDYLTTHYTISTLEEMMKEKGYPYILGYNEATQEYLDLKTLSPDLIFIQTPYDAAYGSKLYKSSYLATFCAVATISYGCSMIAYEGDYYRNWIENNQNFKNLWKSFNETIDNTQMINDSCPNLAVTVGYMKCDKYINYKNNADFTFNEKNKKFTIVWKPRWLGTVGESGFLKYVYYFIYFTKKHPEIDFIFLLHQNLEGYIIHRRIMNVEAFYAILDEFRQLPNGKIIMSDNFLDDVMNADLYIGDYSSTVVEFALTGKPIIYTPCNVSLNEIGKRIIGASYVCENIEQMEDTILKVISGKDDKQSLRNDVKEYLFNGTPKGESYAKFCLSYIIDHYDEMKAFPALYRQNRKEIRAYDKISKKAKKFGSKMRLGFYALLLFFSCLPLFNIVLKRKKILQKVNKCAQ